ncbi:MAG: redoxin domain-containing protein [bacterium]
MKFSISVLMFALIMGILVPASVLAQETSDPIVENSAPDFTIQTIGGGTFTLSRYRDNAPIIVASWVSWDPACKDAMLELQNFYTTYIGQFGIIALSGNPESDLDMLKKFAEDNNLKFNIALDPEKEAINLFSHDKLPAFTLVNLDGSISKTYDNLDNDTRSEIISIFNLTEPETAEEYATRGYNYYDRWSDFDRALKDFDTALKLDQDNSEAICGKGEIILDQGNIEEAKGYLDKAIEINKSNTRAYYNRANVEILQKNYQTALEIYDKGLNDNPGDDFLIGRREIIENKLKVLNTPAPAFTVTTIKGDEINLEKFKGNKAVIIDSWATWCPPCRQEMPELQKFYEKHSENVEIIAASKEKELDKITEFIETNGFTFQIVQDVEGKIGDLYPSKFIPFLTVVNRDGIIVETFTGYNEGLIEELEELLDLKEEPLPIL